MKDHRTISNLIPDQDFAKVCFRKRNCFDVNFVCIWFSFIRLIADATISMMIYKTSKALTT